MVLASLVVAFYGFALLTLFDENPSYKLLLPPFLITSFTLIGLISIYHEKSKWIFILASLAFFNYLTILGPFRFWEAMTGAIAIGVFNAFSRKKNSINR